MNSPGTVVGHERLRLFCALTLPDDVLDRLERWQAETLDRGRIVPRPNLHITLAFLGHRPTAELESIAAAVREAAWAAGRPELTVRRYRETRSVGMLVLDDAGDRA